MIRIGIAGSKRRRHFVRHKIQRKVEGGDAENRTDRETAKYAKMGIEAGRPIERNHFPGYPPGFFGSHRKGLNRPD